MRVVATRVWPRCYRATFILAKAGKYIFCFLTDPSPGDAKSQCRSLN
jgi:hypothetical protein